MRNTTTMAELSRDVFNLFGMWGIEPRDQITLLGLPEETRPRALTHYRSEPSSIPDDDITRERFISFIAMHEALLHAFPHNESLANYWVTTESDFFYGKSPLDVMLNSDIEGIRYVLSHLKQDESW